MRRGRRRTIGLLVALAALAALVVIGRVERRDQVAGQARGIARVREAVGSITSRTLSGYRVAPNFTCLDYSRPHRVYGLELCFDNAFRVLEASDRRGAQPKVYSLRFEPSAHTVVLQANQVDHAIARLRTRVMPTVWSVIVSSLQTCSLDAYGLSRSTVVAARTEWQNVHDQCVDALQTVGNYAHVARDGGAPALQTTGEALDLVAKFYVAAVDDLNAPLFASHVTAVAGLTKFRVSADGFVTEIRREINTFLRANPQFTQRPVLRPR